MAQIQAAGYQVRMVRMFFVVECVALVFLGIFYFSCGQALYIRESDGCIDEFYATGDVGELTEGMVVSQTYTLQMDILDTVGVMVSGYEKSFTGNLHIRCEYAADGGLIAEKTFSASELGTGQYIYLDLMEGKEVSRGSLVRILCTSDGTPGNAPTVFYYTDDKPQNEDAAYGAQMAINGKDVQGTLCIAIRGRDRVWTGPNYWKLILFTVLAVAGIYLLEVFRFARGKRSCLFCIVEVFKRYSFLIWQLVVRDFKVRYKRSLLGVIWSFLNPLLTMVVQYLVFSQLFRSDIENYPVYLLSGLVIFNFFNEGVGQALGSIVGNASLITKVYIPKYIYPVSRVLSSGINLLMSLLPLMLAAVFTGERICKAYLLLPYILACVMVFTMGLGMVLAAGMTFFRDVQFLWGIISMLWMYLTPLFYPVSIVPQAFRGIILHNPMYIFVSAVREIVLGAGAPRPMVFAQCTLVALAMFAIGSFVFQRTQDRFVFYI